jgi:hypothetical protein
MVFITIHAVSIDSFSVICVGGQINVGVCVSIYALRICQTNTLFQGGGGGGGQGGEGSAPQRYITTR